MQCSGKSFKLNYFTCKASVRVFLVKEKKKKTTGSKKAARAQMTKSILDTPSERVNYPLMQTETSICYIICFLHSIACTHSLSIKMQSNK